MIDEYPELALAHARFARTRASRVAVVREAAGITAYHAGEWAEALGEFRAGVMAMEFGPVPAVVLGGLGALAVVALWMRLFPDLAHIKSVAPESPP